MILNDDFRSGSYWSGNFGSGSATMFGKINKILYQFYEHFAT
jgi:hypothetical protein